MTPRITIRTGVSLAILAMGVLVIIAALVTGESYRRLTMDNEREAFKRLAEINIHFIVTQTMKSMTEHAMSVQAGPGFREPFDRRDEPALNRYLNEHLNRLYFRSTLLDVEKLVAYDARFNRVGYSSDSRALPGAETTGCPDLLEEARRRTGPSRLRIRTRLCETDGRPYIAALVPIGGLHLKGYLLINVDPTQNVIAAEEELGMPLRLSTGSERNVFESDAWPGSSATDTIMQWRYVMQDRDGSPIYIFDFAADIAPLREKLTHTRYVILAFATIVTLVAVAIVVLLLQRTVLKPLGRLTRHVRLVRADQARLCDPVEVDGNYEVAELAEGFNGMSQKLCSLYKELKEMAFVDSLTGLPNRAVFYDRMEQAIRLARRSGSFAVLMLDLDRFKHVNDTLGHHIGDRLLQEMARRLEHCTRASDTVARLGGDEFAILLPSLSEPEETIGIVRKIITSVAEPVRVDGHDLRIRTSVGIVYCPGDGVFSDRLMQKADVAMYHAKQTRSGFAFYRNDLDKSGLNQPGLDAELAQAIEDDDLELLYQPKIGLAGQRVLGMKALPCWKHTGHGILMPEDFIPLIEQDGLSLRLADWILHKCFAQAALWRDEGMELDISINLPLPGGDAMRVVEAVQHARKSSDAQIPPITVELNERDVSVDIDQARRLVDGLRNAGMHIAVTGCGGHRSTLSDLEALAVDEIHIDRSFVFYMDKDSSDAAIVKSTIEAAHEMGLEVVAEGVETEAAWRMLVDLGCDVVQGRYFSPLLGGHEVSGWMESFERRDGSRTFAGASGA